MHIPTAAEVFASLIQELVAKSLPLVERITPECFVSDTGQRYFFISYRLTSQTLSFHSPSGRKIPCAYRLAESALLQSIAQHPNFHPYIPTHANRTN
ncbi:hypothetical protein ACW9KT_10810 [Hymenobacter sp. HD11105]